ncbi:streptophobe family protein [Streptomyces sp. PKU-MA01144]|uniref:streptophobe family protein n=1 Tax=Streptomyces sp. PKU-MA01144 TaxID=2729138 RepID=UPI00147F3B56|nr:streptophobe family protein [Streptomyces sp. PKU-MA01144]
MSRQPPTPRRGAAHGLRDWRDALVAVVAGFAAMLAVAAAGLWAAGAADLPGGAFPRVVAAVVVLAAGGEVPLAGDAGFLARSQAELAVMPLSVSLVGALVVATAFLRPLRHRAVAGTRELLGRFARLAVLWLAALAGLTAVARTTFRIPLGEDSPLTDIGEFLDAAPRVGFRAETGPSLLYGLLWLIGVAALALLVSRRAPLPPRLVGVQEVVRPAAYAMVWLLLAYVVVGLCAGIVVAVTQGHPGRTFAVILLGLPNLAWPALTLGMGATWEGRVEGPFGLPMPQLLDSVLRGEDRATLNVATLAEQDARAWWLVVVAAVLVPAAAFLMAARSPARTRPWQHALRMGAALALTVLVVCLTGRIAARVGLSLLGVGDLEGLGGEVSLQPRLWAAVGIGLGWGIVAGLLGALLAAPVRRRGAVKG